MSRTSDQQKQTPPQVRCAIYTRKSTDENLDLDDEDGHGDLRPADR